MTPQRGALREIPRRITTCYHIESLLFRVRFIEFSKPKWQGHGRCRGASEDAEGRSQAVREGRRSQTPAGDEGPRRPGATDAAVRAGKEPATNPA